MSEIKDISNPDHPARVRLWEGIEAYARSCNGDPYTGNGNPMRHKAVVSIEASVNDIVFAFLDLWNKSQKQCTAETTFRFDDHQTYRCWRPNGHEGDHEGHEIVASWTDETTRPIAPPVTQDDKFMHMVAKYVDEWRAGDAAWHAASHIRAASVESKCASCEIESPSQWCGNCVISDYQATCGCAKCVSRDESSDKE